MIAQFKPGVGGGIGIVLLAVIGCTTMTDRMKSASQDPGKNQAIPATQAGDKVDGVQISYQMRFIEASPALAARLRPKLQRIAGTIGEPQTALPWGSLDEKTIDAFQAAAKQDAGSIALGVPRITADSGQQAVAHVLSQQAYTADFKEVNGQYEPVVKTFQSGVYLEVQGTVSADRASVSLAVDAAWIELKELTSQPFKAAGEENLTFQQPKSRKRDVKAAFQTSDPKPVLLALGGATPQDKESTLFLLIKPTVIEPAR
jgi:hypothetical protein